MNQEITDIAPCMNRPAKYRMRNANTRIFNTYQQYFYILYHQHNGRSKIFQNLSFILLDLSQK